MLKQLRKRFIVYNMLVIFSVFGLLSFFIFMNPKSDLTVHRYVNTFIQSLILVFIASFIISKYALKPIKQSWKKQLDFTADASHELRSPLASIKANLEIVMDCKEETIESQMKWLQNIEIEHTRMTKLVDNLLTLSRLDTGEQNLFITTFLLSELIQEAINTFMPMCIQKNITLYSKIDKSISFLGDESRILQLIVILLDNAVKYTQNGGSITVYLYRKGKKVKIIVRDTGAGISKKDLPQIFERFYRADNTRQKNQNGSGLGLSIAKWIVEQHEGQILFYSKLGEGTECVVEL